MRRASAPLLLCLGLTAALPVPVRLAHAASDVKDLPERHRKWLTEDVVWIITEDEKEDFLALKTEDEREGFVTRFWGIRDPQPLSVENEYREEHYRRVAWANRNLGGDSPRKGCLTERGRVYILLGKPDDVERVVSANETYPYEMWFYGRNTARLGLPGQLRLLFYRQFGTGEFRLMNPVLDRDRLFPPSSQIDPNNYRMLQEILGPEVSLAVQSVAPGEGGTGSAAIVQELLQPRRIPERLRDQAHALNPSVMTRLSLVSLELKLASLVVPQSDGTARVHLGVVLPPAELSFQDVGQDRWTSRVDVFGDITNARGAVVARFDEIATISLPKAELEKRRGHAFAFETMRVLVPGRYRVKLMVQDFGKGKLGRAEQEIEVAIAPAVPGTARIEPFTLASRVDRSDSGVSDSAFTLAGFQLRIPAASRFPLGGSLYAFGILQESSLSGNSDLDIEVTLLRGTDVLFSATAKSPASSSVAGRRPLLLSVPTRSLAAGACELAVKIKKGEVVVATETRPLELVTEPTPQGYFRWTEKKSAAPEVEHYNRGAQLLSSGDLEGAEKAFRISLDHRRGFRPSQVQLARVLALRGKAEEAEAEVERILAGDPENYDALVTRGSLRIARSDWAGASQALEQALALGTRTKEVLNALGEAAIGLGDKVKARQWLEASLEIDSNQELVKRRLAELGR